MMKQVIFIAGILILYTSIGYGQTAGLEAKAEMKNAQGEKVGTLTLRETPQGVLILADLMNLPPGSHAFHIHETGKCEPPFKTAGGHFNPEKTKHGIMNPEGMHAGDLPNIHVGSDGRLKFEVIARQVTIGKGPHSLFDEDGSAIVVHEGPDDYRSDPAGDAGPRIACGVIMH